MKYSKFMLVFALALVAVVSSLNSSKAQEGDEGSRYERGVEVYLEMGCGVCHAFGLAGTTGMFGPGHDAMGVIAGARILDPSYRGSATDAGEYIRESIVAPLAYVVPGYGATYHRMPEYSFLDDEDLDALVDLLLSGRPGEGRGEM